MLLMQSGDEAPPRLRNLARMELAHSRPQWRRMSALICGHYTVRQRVVWALVVIGVVNGICVVLVFPPSGSLWLILSYLPFALIPVSTEVSRLRRGIARRRFMRDRRNQANNRAQCNAFTRAIDHAFGFEQFTVHMEDAVLTLLRMSDLQEPFAEELVHNASVIAGCEAWEGSVLGRPGELLPRECTVEDLAKALLSLEQLAAIQIGDQSPVQQTEGWPMRVAQTRRQGL